VAANSFIGKEFGDLTVFTWHPGFWRKDRMKLLLGMALVLGLTAPVFSAEKDIVDTAVGAGQFMTLAAALQAAGLVDTLKGAGPFTVLAPTDEAFAKYRSQQIRTGIP
jgi:hypothetical protein